MSYYVFPSVQNNLFGAYYYLINTSIKGEVVHIYDVVK